MSPMHQEPSMQPLPIATQTAGRGRGQVGRLERVHFKSSPWIVQGCSEGNPRGGRARWHRQPLRILWPSSWVSRGHSQWGKRLWPMLDMGKVPKLLPPLLAPVQGMSLKRRGCCFCTGRAAPRSSTITLSSVPPTNGVVETGLRMSASAALCTWVPQCDSLRLTWARPCCCSLHAHLMDMNLPACFSPLKINWKLLGAIQLNY